MKNIMLFFVALLMSAHVLAQQTVVSGTITDANDGSPLIGANVLVKGTTIGTIADINGKFSINIPSGRKVLVISCIGYKQQEVTLTAGQRTVNIAMKEDSELLDEVVVVGYGTMKKSDLSGASTSVGENKIKGSIITNLDQALQGRAAGVSSVATSGAPGSSSSIRVRGDATINANAEPLYVIDGVIVQSSGSGGASLGLGSSLGNGSISTVSPIASINPSDIVSMEILKDASATAIYGSLGSNGVVLITTKRGKAGEAKFSYDGLVAAQRQSKRLDMMNLREFASYYNDLVGMGEMQKRDDLSDTSLLGVGTNWQDAIFRTALQQSHQISAQGGTDKSTYYVSASVMDQDGTIIGSNFNRYSFRVNLDAQLKKWLKLGVNAMYSGTSERLTLADSDEGIVNYSLQTPPDIPIYNIDGTYCSVVKEGYSSPNPVALAMSDDILLDRTKLSGSFFADITPVKNLTWHAEFGYDINYTKGERYQPMISLGSWKRASNYSAIQKQNSSYWQLKNYVTYNGQIGKHSYTAMVGQECWESKYDLTNVSNTGLLSDAVHNPALGTGTPAINAGFGSGAMASFFTRLTYNYADRYLGTYTYRYDGSSNFGPDNRWAGFHSLAVSWRFSNEKFFESIRSVINNGKFRFGWGQTGNQGIPPYAWGASIAKMPTDLGMGYRVFNISNPGIQWETQEQINLGLDLSFFNDRISLTVDAYDRKSENMLMEMQLPTYVGSSIVSNWSSRLHPPKGNFGHISNKGLEITLTTRPLVGNFQWDSEFQISFNKNKLKALTGTDSSPIVGYGQWSDVVSLTNIGESMYSFYGYVCDGVYKDLDDIKTSAKPAKYPTDGVFNRYNTVWVGDIKYKDISGPNGVPDGVIDEYDRTNIGSPLPKFTFGFTNTFRYKDFDLSLFLTGSYGNKVYNYIRMKLDHMNSAWQNQLTTVNNRTILTPIDATKDYSQGVVVNGVTVWNWYDDITNVQVGNPGAKLPRASVADPNDNDRISDRYIEDGSYIRLKNITLGYTFPKKMIRKIGLDNLRVYANIQNLVTLTDYSGYDPEIGVSTAGNNVYGLDNGRYPSPTVYSFGLNVSF